MGLANELKVVLLSGGSGGAKFARGLQDHCGENLTVIANTADDIEIYGSYVSPDPDLICYWLSDQIDERGWGIAGDTFTVMNELEKLGTDIWFRLGDRDLAACLHRKELLDSGLTLTESIQTLSSALGVPAKVLPMSNDPVRTWVTVNSTPLPLQRYLIQHAADSSVDGVELRGVERAKATEEVLTAIDSADLVFIGPSNPVISIEPILLTGGIEAALKSCSAPVIAVSPIVQGKVLKGPTAQMLRSRGLSVNAEGVAEIYSGLIDGLLCDETVQVEDLQTFTAQTELGSSDSRKSVTEQALQFGTELIASKAGA